MSVLVRHLGLAVVAVGLAMTLAACGGEQAAGGGEQAASPTPSDSASVQPVVTFVELGSDNCIPCREMRPVMEAVIRDYSPKVAVVFYDVYEQRDMAQQFGVRVIPTQVFLDEGGEEFYRHEGFLPREAIEELLTERGVEPVER